MSTRCFPRPGRGKIRRKSERIEKPGGRTGRERKGQEESVREGERKKERTVTKENEKKQKISGAEEGSTTYYLVA